MYCHRRAALFCVIALLVATPSLSYALGVSESDVVASGRLPGRRLAAAEVPAKPAAGAQVGIAGSSSTAAQPTQDAASQGKQQATVSIAAAAAPAAVPSVQQPASPVQLQAVQSPAAAVAARRQEQQPAQEEEMDVLLQSHFMPEDWKQEQAHTQRHGHGDEPSEHDGSYRHQEHYERDEPGYRARPYTPAYGGEHDDRRYAEVSATRLGSSDDADEAWAELEAAAEEEEMREQQPRQAQQQQQQARVPSEPQQATEQRPSAQNNPIADAIQRAVQADQAAEAAEDERKAQEEARASEPKPSPSPPARAPASNYTQPSGNGTGGWHGITAHIEQSIDFDHTTAKLAGGRRKRGYGKGSKDKEEEEYSSEEEAEEGAYNSEEKDSSKKKRLSKYFYDSEDSEDGGSDAYDGEEIAISGYARPSSARYNRGAKKQQRHGAAKAAGTNQPKVVIMSSNAQATGLPPAAKKGPTTLGGLLAQAAASSVRAATGGGDNSGDEYADSDDTEPTSAGGNPGGQAWIKQDIKGHMQGKMKKNLKVKNVVRFDEDGKPYSDQTPGGEYTGYDKPYDRSYDNRGGKHPKGARGGRGSGGGYYDNYGDRGYDDGYYGGGYDSPYGAPYGNGSPYGRRGYYDDLDQDYYWDPKSNGQGSHLRKKEARNVYNFVTSSERYYAGQTVPYGSTDAAQAPILFTYTNDFTCGASGAPSRVGSCTSFGTIDPVSLEGQISITCTLHEDASNLCGLKYVQGMVIAAQGPVKLTNPSSKRPRITANMIPITGIYMPNRRTTLLADVVTLLSGVKGGALMFDTNTVDNDGKFTFYFWR